MNLINTKQDLIDNLKVLKGNEVYRYGDVVNNGLEKIRRIIKTDKKYSKTILRMFLDKGSHLKKKPDKYNFLKQVVKAYIKYKKIQLPKDDALVIHIRAGDDYKGRGLGNNRIYEKLKKEIQHHYSSKEITHIVIVTALHYGVAENSKLYSKNHKYSYKETNYNENINILYNFIKDQTCPVHLLSSTDIDYDFCYLCNANHLITTGGGFSKIVSELKEKKKNDSVRKLNIYELNPSMVVSSVPVLPIGVIDNKYNRFFYSTPRN
jgi:hypothetical protein